jgi:ATP-dependent Clp protease protease subunit|tara:strand:- start:72 stop:743 length:672 start_codon:yes stop_codon:yes gene_type:complete
MIGLTKKSKDKKKTKQQEAEEEESSEEETKQVTLVDLLGGGPEESGPEGRSIMFVGDVTEEKAADLISALLVLAQTKDEEDDRAEDIKLYISTYGGSADEMFGIYDVMNFCKQFCDIQTIGLGKVMSAGTLLLAAGTKGKRYVGNHTRVMIHSVNGGSIGELHNLQNEMEQIAGLQESYIQAMSNETSMTKRQIQTLINRKVNVYLSSEEALEKGLADEVWNG